jgi:hypothetical protein
MRLSGSWAEYPNLSKLALLSYWWLNNANIPPRVRGAEGTQEEGACVELTFVIGLLIRL